MEEALRCADLREELTVRRRTRWPQVIVDLSLLVRRSILFPGSKFIQAFSLGRAACCYSLDLRPAFWDVTTYKPEWELD